MTILESCPVAVPPTSRVSHMPHEPLTILTFDPGKATGWCVFQPHEPSDTGFAAGEYDDWHKFAHWVDIYIPVQQGRGHRVIVVGEHFTISQRTIKTAVDYSALYLNGAVQQSCWEHDADFKFQTAAMIKAKPNIATNANLKKLGWYTPTKGGHANDAVRHMVHFIKDKAYGQEILGRLL